MIFRQKFGQRQILTNANLKWVNTVWDCSCPATFSWQCLYWMEKSLSSGLGFHTRSQTNRQTDRLHFHVSYIQESKKEAYCFFPTKKWYYTQF